MRLATPISHLFRDADAGARIAAASDCLECRDWCADSRLPRQELFHFDQGIQIRWDREVQADLARIFSMKTELKLVTFQIPSCYDAPVLEGRFFQPGGRRLGRREMIESIRDNVAWLRSVLRPGVDIGIENNNYYPTPAYEDIADSSFLAEAVEMSGCLFLLDIAHAHISAHNRGEMASKYMEGLPMNRLVQIHLCGPSLPERGTAFDEHEWPDDGLTEEALRLGAARGARYLTVEYYKNADRLVEGLAALRRRIAGSGGVK